MDVVTFLKQSVNNVENVKDLLTLFLKRGKYNFGAIFLRHNNTMYNIIDHVNIE